MKRTLLMSLLFISTALTAGVAWASPPVRVSPGVSATVASLAPGTRAILKTLFLPVTAGALVPSTIAQASS